MATINSSAKLELEYPPSCVVSVPTQLEYYLIGTYYLHPEEEKSKESQNEQSKKTQEEKPTKQKRSGSLLLVRHEGLSTQTSSSGLLTAQPPDAAVDENLSVISSVSTDFGILDIKFFNTSGRFCTANSTGSVAISEIHTHPDREPEITQLKKFQLWDPQILALSLSFWDEPPLLGVTLSNGEVAVCSLTEDLTSVFDPRVVASHSDLEAWTSIFARGGTLTIFSGGDDAVLQYTCLSEHNTSQDEDQSAVYTLWANQKIHGAGVTAILPLSADRLLTGSYDDHIRLLDISKRPRVLAEANLGGGVWRLMPLDQNTSEKKHSYPLIQVSNTKYIDMLACCMHAGTRIVRVTVGDNPSITVLAKFEENESMNYGAAVGRHTISNETSLYNIVSVSFYDKMAFLWKSSVPDAAT